MHWPPDPNAGLDYREAVEVGGRFCRSGGYGVFVRFWPIALKNSAVATQEHE